VGFDAPPFRDAISCSLELLNAAPLKRTEDDDGRTVWEFPPLDKLAQTDPSWAATMDTLRVPMKRGEKRTQWRKEQPIRPVTFEDAGKLTDDTVHLHLEQRVAQRLLARFRAQGFVHHDLSRACLAQTKDSVPRVVLLGRLSLYGQRAERLHEEIIPLTARWIDPDQRHEPLKAYARDAERTTIELLDASLGHGGGQMPDPAIQTRLLEAAALDIEQLLPQLEPRAHDVADSAIEKLRQRGAKEERELREILVRQREAVARELERHDSEFQQLTLEFDPEEKRQLEANIKSWHRKLEQLDQDIDTEPRRIRAFYEVKARWVEPVGLVYLWPETN
jgi:hypothetical protein